MMNFVTPHKTASPMQQNALSGSRPLDALIISDLHLGSVLCRAKELGAFLQQQHQAAAANPNPVLLKDLHGLGMLVNNVVDYAVLRHLCGRRMLPHWQPGLTEDVRQVLQLPAP